MSAPAEKVGLLAVLKCAAETTVRMKGAGANPGLAHAQRDALLWALDVVAELIAADEEFDAAKAEQDESASYDYEGAYVPKAVYERMKAATVRRDAALARVGGDV